MEQRESEAGANAPQGRKKLYLGVDVGSVSVDTVVLGETG
jgi:activator of 2-hydroxyglutaryl-CoA dehydratase